MCSHVAVSKSYIAWIEHVGEFVRREIKGGEKKAWQKKGGQKVNQKGTKRKTVLKGIW